MAILGVVFFFLLIFFSVCYIDYLLRELFSKIIINQNFYINPNNNVFKRENIKLFYMRLGFGITAKG